MRYSVSTIIMIAVIFLPDFASAQLVQCDGLLVQCDACQLVSMINRIVQFVIAMFSIIAVLLLAWAGVGLITSGGDQSALEKFKSMFTNLVIGLILILASWMIVNVILLTLTGRGLTFWGVTTCGEMVTPVDSPVNNTDADLGVGSITAGGGELTPVAESPAGKLCYNGPDGKGGTSDDVCFDAQNVTGGNYNYKDASHLGYEKPGAFISVELMKTNPQISPNFRLCDVTRCDSDARKGDYIFIDPFAVAQLENVRSSLGGNLKVNSGYRSPGYNSGIPKAAPHSRHQYGDAFDIAITKTNTEAKIERSCWAAGATDVFTYSSGKHVHCDWRAARR